MRVLPSGLWVQLSPRLRVLCVSDHFQDAALLLDLDGHLVVDPAPTTCSGRGWLALAVDDLLSLRVTRYRCGWRARTASDVLSLRETRSRCQARALPVARPARMRRGPRGNRSGAARGRSLRASSRA